MPYDPSIGRYISAKDISELAPYNIMGFNLYTYACNSPVIVNAYTEEIAKAYGTSVIYNYINIGGIINGNGIGGNIFKGINWLEIADFGAYFTWGLAAIKGYKSLKGATSVLDILRGGAKAVDNVFGYVAVGFDAIIYGYSWINTYQEEGIKAAFASAVYDGVAYYISYWIMPTVGAWIGGGIGAGAGGLIGLLGGPGRAAAGAVIGASIGAPIGAVGVSLASELILQHYKEDIMRHIEENWEYMVFGPLGGWIYNKITG